MKRTLRRLWPILPFVLCAASVIQAQPVLDPPLKEMPATAIPDTPAGERFEAWLHAINTGDQAAIKAFVEAFATTPAPSIEAILGLRQRTGGFDLRRIEESSETKLVALLQEREGEQFVRTVIEVDTTPERRILAAPIRPIPTPPEFAVQRLSDAELAKQLDTHLQELAARDAFSGAVLIIKGGNTVFSGAYGLAERERGLPNELDSKFRFASMGKMFTATAVIQLVQAGRISLADPVSKFLPDYPNKNVAEKVTVEQLLTHTGGTGDIFTPEFIARAAELQDLEDYIELFGNRELRFAPGSRYEYSNYGYILLGLIIEAASGEDYYDYLERNIFDPSKMKSTGFWHESQPLEGRVTGYAPGPDGVVPATGAGINRGSPAGGGVSTVGDMFLFAQALINYELLDSEHTELLLTGKVQMGPNIKYAFGFGDVDRGTPRHHVGHSGGAPGQNGDLRIYTQAGYVVVVLSNFSPPAAQRVSDYIANRLQI